MNVISRAWFTSVALALVLPTTAGAENIGTSCADCPSYNGAFSITNETGVAVKYQFKWGSNKDWRLVVLSTGRKETHSFPLGSNREARIPTPYIRFDDFGGDNVSTFKEYKMLFHAVGYAGYGPKADRTEPMAYYFKYAADGKHLDLKAR